MDKFYQKKIFLDTLFFLGFWVQGYTIGVQGCRAEEYNTKDSVGGTGRLPCSSARSKWLSVRSAGWLASQPAEKGLGAPEGGPSTSPGPGRRHFLCKEASLQRNGHGHGPLRAPLAAFCAGCSYISDIW